MDGAWRRIARWRRRRTGIPPPGLLVWPGPFRGSCTDRSGFQLPWPCSSSCAPPRDACVRLRLAARRTRRAAVPTRCSSWCMDWMMARSEEAAVCPESTVTSSSTAVRRAENNPSTGCAVAGAAAAPCSESASRACSNPGEIGLQPVLLLIGAGSLAQVSDHQVDVVLELGDLAARSHFDGLGQVAFREGWQPRRWPGPVWSGCLPAR